MECLASLLNGHLFTGMASEEECLHEMFVLVAWHDRTFGVPLAQLTGIEVDTETAETIADWRD